MRKLCGALLFLPALAFATPGDEQFLAAREAYRVGDIAKLDRIAAELQGNDLDPWIRYWALRSRIEQDDGAGIGDFLKREAGSYLAERLRGDWLKMLGKHAQWARFQDEYPSLVQPDQETVCFGWQARLARRDASALDEARAPWFSGAELPDACYAVMDRLVDARRLGAEDVWQRVRRLLEVSNLREVRRTAKYLTAAPEATTMDRIAANPARYLDRKLPKNFAATRLGRELALFAVQRLARQDPQEAALRWRRIENRFTAEERGYAWGQLATQAARRHMAEALGWYAAATGSVLTADQMEWQVRAALRATDWAAVIRAISAMPPQLAAKSDWTYWLARALAVQGNPGEAQALFRSIADQTSFYGNLAADELGRPPSVPPRAAAPSSEELAQAVADPALRRAMALLRLDMRVEGVREWNWAVRNMTDRQLLATAELARRNDIYDRAIFTADRTLAEHDFSLRYLAPYREEVEPKARQLELSGGWVYGLMRQESRFVTNAHSSAGAKGLMQVMPATAKWVARKIGLNSYHPARAADMEVNVTLGTHYLKMVLDGLGNHPVLASAAYNAGPGRARRWVGDRPMEGAIYTETIPFGETRDYVKKVMSNSVYYALLLDEKPQSLKSRLGIISPRLAGTSAHDDLP